MKFGKSKGYSTYTTKKGASSFTHRRVMEKKLGGKLRAGVVVHHVNEKKWDYPTDTSRRNSSRTVL